MNLLINRNILTFLFSCIVSISFGQDFNLNYEPLNCEYPENATVLLGLENRVNKDISRLSDYKYTRDYREIYVERYNRLVDEFFDNHFFYDDKLTIYFQNIFNNILDKNASIPQYELRLVISRSPIPNAINYGEGTIVINIGLIKRLETESQIAFILCHELAHYMENHSNVAIEKYIVNKNARSTKKAIRAIKRSQYNKREQYENLVKGFAYDNSRHSRYSESEADSIALTFMKNTDYDLQEAVNAMKILDEIDEPKSTEQVDYTEALSFETYPFKENWLNKETVGMSFKMKKESDWNIDSLKTHPECSTRIIELERQIQRLSNQGKLKFIQAEIEFQKIIVYSEFEIIEQAAFYENLGKTIYYTLQLLSKYPNNIYLNATLANSFQQVYTVKREHTATKYIDLPSDRYDDNYKELLEILQNLRSKEALEIANAILESDKNEFTDDEFFLYTLTYQAYLNKDKTNFDTLKTKYLSEYSDGQYKTKIEDLTL